MATLAALLLSITLGAGPVEKPPTKPHALAGLTAFDYDATYQGILQGARNSHADNPGRAAMEKTADFRQSQYPNDPRASAAANQKRKRALWALELKWIDSEHDRLNREDSQRALKMAIENQDKAPAGPAE